MNASKENAIRAIGHLEEMERGADGVFADYQSNHADSFEFIKAFLEAAKRKLPKEESFIKDKKR